MSAYPLAVFRLRQSLILGDGLNASRPQFHLIHGKDCLLGLRPFFCKSLTERYRRRLFVENEISRLYRKSLSCLD